MLLFNLLMTSTPARDIQKMVIWQHGNPTRGGSDENPPTFLCKLIPPAGDDLAGFELASWTSTTHLSLQDVIEFKGREGGLVIGKCFLQSDELSYNPDDIEIIFEVVAQKVEPN